MTLASKLKRTLYGYDPELFDTDYYEEWRYEPKEDMTAFELQVILRATSFHAGWMLEDFAYLRPGDLPEHWERIKRHYRFVRAPLKQHDTS